jgi:hypothetical protein
MMWILIKAKGPGRVDRRQDRTKLAQAGSAALTPITAGSDAIADTPDVEAHVDIVVLPAVRVDESTSGLELILLVGQTCCSYCE